MPERPARYGEPARARLTRQGQITVPKSIRDVLGAAPGDDLVFDVGPDGVRLGVARSPRLVDMAALGAVESWPWTEDDIERMVADEVGRAYLAKVSRLAQPAAVDSLGDQDIGRTRVERERDEPARG